MTPCHNIENDRSKETIESRGYFGNYVIKDVAEYWDNLLPDQRPVFERYFKGREDIHVHFRVGDEYSTGYSGEYCLAFHCAQAENLKLSALPPFFAREKHVSRDSECSEIPSRDMEHSVLVNVRKLIELPERVGTKIPPALVRLQPLYHCLRFWVDRLEHLHSVVPKPIGTKTGHTLATFVPDDWELRFACGLFREWACVDFRERKNQVIQTAAEILDTIPEHKRKGIDGDWVNTGLDEKVGRIVWIGIESGRMQVTIDPFVQRDIQIFQVLSRSLDFEDVRQFWGAHSGCSLAVCKKEFKRQDH